MMPMVEPQESSADAGEFTELLGAWSAGDTSAPGEGVRAKGCQPLRKWQFCSHLRRRCRSQPSVRGPR